MKPYCQPIRPSSQREELWKKDGDTADIISAIVEVDRRADKDIISADCLRGSTDYETLRNVWAYVKYQNRYRQDRPGHERVQTPGALAASLVGDCKSYSITICALLRSLGFSCGYRFASYDEDGDFTHVYALAKLNGRTVILDSVHSFFDSEVPFARKKDIWTRAKSISGIEQNSSGWIWTLAAVFLTVQLLDFAFKELKK